MGKLENTIYSHYDRKDKVVDNEAKCIRVFPGKNININDIDTLVLTARKIEQEYKDKIFTGEREIIKKSDGSDEILFFFK